MPEHRGRYVVMGVSGCGKTTIGTALARALASPCVEGDEFHPRANIERMAAGIALTDADRAPWLRALADRLRQARDERAGLVISCSALRRVYRDTLREGDRDVRFIFLDGPRDVIAERLASRTGHYMPASLLDSQLAALEPPGPDERAWTCDVTDSPDDIEADLLERIANA